MRIKAVLRDTDILQMEAGSKVRIIAAAKKNINRVVNLPSLLKVMGLMIDDRCIMLEVLKDSNMQVWLFNDANQHLIFLGDKKDAEFEGYQWQ
ncbi:MAG: hypothetical protein E3J86_01440 [Candidatus Thorarchaeota archaeon]|nr:MAG: hypothetical protein E3J86_01440 [Candidatus Thorarchaeota archaeon]